MNYVSKTQYSTNYEIVNMAINFLKRKTKTSLVENKRVNIHVKQAVMVLAFRKSALHLRKRIFDVRLSRCSTDLR